VIQPGDVLSFYQYQSQGSVAGITLCFSNGDGICDDDGNTVDQDAQPIHADRLSGTNHFRKVDLTPSVGLTLSQITLDSNGLTQPGPWDVFFRDIQIISADGTVRSIFTTGSTPTLFMFSSGGASQQGYTIDHSSVPAISSLSATTSSLGNVITITGTNFGTAPSIGTVFFNGATGTPTSWSDTSISLPVPVGATSGNVVVMVGGQASNGVALTIQEDALHISGVNCATCGWQVTDFTFQNSPLYGYVIQPGDVLYFLQNQTSGSVAGITLCFAEGDTICDDDGRTVDQDGQNINADNFQGGNHFRKVDLSPNAGLTLIQITLDSSGFTQTGRWDVLFSDIEIVSADGTVRPVFVTGSTPSLFMFTSGGGSQQSSKVDLAHVW
jgi:hypothetical protein